MNRQDRKIVLYPSIFTSASNRKSTTPNDAPYFPEPDSPLSSPTIGSDDEDDFTQEDEAASAQTDETETKQSLLPLGEWLTFKDKLPTTALPPVFLKNL